MYDFALEDFLYHPTCEKRFYRRFGKHRESEDKLPHKLCLQKIAFKLWLGFENLEMYTLQALRERYTVCSLLWGSILVITRQSNLECQENYSLFHN